MKGLIAAAFVGIEIARGKTPKGMDEEKGESDEEHVEEDEEGVASTILKGMLGVQAWLERKS